jgi:hypothetical protein
MIRVERKKYEGNSQQRSDVEWKIGTDMYSQNAFVSGWPKKVFSFDTRRQVGQVGGSHIANHRQKVVTIIRFRV